MESRDKWCEWRPLQRLVATATFTGVKRCDNDAINSLIKGHNTKTAASRHDYLKTTSSSRTHNYLQFPGHGAVPVAEQIPPRHSGLYVLLVGVPIQQRRAGQCPDHGQGHCCTSSAHVSNARHISVLIQMRETGYRDGGGGDGGRVRPRGTRRYLVT